MYQGPTTPPNPDRVRATTALFFATSYAKLACLADGSASNLYYGLEAGRSLSNAYALAEVAVEFLSKNPRIDRWETLATYESAIRDRLSSNAIVSLTQSLLIQSDILAEDAEDRGYYLIARASVTVRNLRSTSGGRRKNSRSELEKSAKILASGALAMFSRGKFVGMIEPADDFVRAILGGAYETEELRDILLHAASQMRPTAR